jgi:dipeptidyl aminopeptidase/acylaminoacyl peptidase
MKSFLFAVCFVTVSTFQSQTRSIGNLSLENIPEIPTSIIETSTQYQNMRAASLIGFHPQSAAMLISTRFGETAQLHLVKQSMGYRQQITFFKEPITAATYCPSADRKGFLFLKDEGGNEFSQIFFMDETTGKARLLSDGGRSLNNLPVWNNKGNYFAYTSTRRNQKDYDLYLGDLNAQPVTTLKLELSGSWQVLDWSPNDQLLLLKHYISANKTELYTYELVKNKLTEIQHSDEEIAYGPALFAANGTAIYFCSDEGTDFQVLNYLDLSTKKKRAISRSMNWDVHLIKLNTARTKLVFAANENGIDKLYYCNTTDLVYKPLDDVPHGVLSGLAFHPDGKTLGFSVSTPSSPGDAYTLQLDTKSLQRWTESEIGGLNAQLFPIPETIFYPSFDAVKGVPRLIPALLYSPKNKTSKTPVVIQIHGGPEGQSRPAFNPLIAYLVNELGIAVLLPNVRGSTGYGKDYLKLDNGFLREGAVNDIGKLLDYIGTRKDLDTARIAVMGGSYGGYMSLACMFNFNSRLRCGIDVVGISNFVSFLKNTEDYRKDLRRVEYGDERDPKMNEFLERISPLNNVTKITRPMFIVQGANDPRVPRSEAEQMKTKLLSQGNTVWYLLAADEGHGFKKKNNIDVYQWSSLLFLQEYLLK